MAPTKAGAPGAPSTAHQSFSQSTQLTPGVRAYGGRKADSITLADHAGVPLVHGKQSNPAEGLPTPGLGIGLWQQFLTVAGMVAVITAVLPGSAGGLLAAVASGHSLVAGLVAGVVLAAAALTALMRYQHSAWIRGSTASLSSAVGVSENSLERGAFEAAGPLPPDDRVLKLGGDFVHDLGRGSATFRIVKDLALRLQAPGPPSWRRAAPPIRTCAVRYPVDVAVSSQTAQD